ncbi:MAG: cytochrome c biogenesis protein CcsA, partial [Proteobacteria bacterium]|nr:cytochrome c biogenesis protein CcsA [Pseudomonadota bacterium]
MIGANCLMVYALLVNDFSVLYVTEVGSLNSPIYIRLVALWSSLNGSILFWGAVLGMYILGLIWDVGDRHREYMPYTLHVMLCISVFFALIVASIADPFQPVSPVPLDGPGPNALLQNHWLMAFHPPTLYLGYVGMSVPFSMICAALLTGRLDAGWMAPLRRWMLIPWIFLTIGLLLGGWWSYGVLGWGGYWSWDPVENASLHPWLTGTAFLHSAMVLQRRGRLRDWTLILGMLTFLLTLIGTFMTRSGVFNSVHSFTQSDIGPVFLVFIGICLVYAVVLLALRSPVLEAAA